MNVNLPKPPVGSSRFIQHLFIKLKETFGRIRPASGWKDKEAPLANAKVAGANVPTWAVVLDGIYAYKFSATAMNEVWITFHLPHDMAYAYTDVTGIVQPPKLYPHVHWSSDGTNTGTARYGIEYTYAKGYGVEVFPASTTVYIEQASDGTANKHFIAEVADVDAIANPEFETDGLLLCRVFRDGAHANDTLTDASFVFTVDMHYLSDGLETVERNRNTAGTIPWTKQSVL